MFERFRWGLTGRALLHWAVYSAAARNPLRLPALHFVSERIGVLAEYGGVAVKLPLGLRSLTPLRPPFSGQFACLQKGLACEGAWRSCMDGASHGFAFGAKTLAQN